MKATGTVTGSELTENYVHTLGDGSYTITDFDPSSDSGSDTLTFIGLNADDVTFSHGSSNDLIITMSNGETITINNQFDTDFDYAVNQMIFADGTSFYTQGTRDKTVADMKATGIVTGSELAENYKHALGDGSYTITDYDPGRNTAHDYFEFIGLNADDVVFPRGASNDLVMTLSNGEAVTINNHFDTDWDYKMDRFVFADGSVLAPDAIDDLLIG